MYRIAISTVSACAHVFAQCVGYPVVRNIIRKALRPRTHAVIFHTVHTANCMCRVYTQTQTVDKCAHTHAHALT